MSKQIVTFGEIMLRLAPPNLERILQSAQFQATFGGGEANVAVTLASLGLNAAYATVLPQVHPVADALIGELRRFGVDTSKIVRGNGRFGVYFVEMGANQRPSRVTYDRDGSAMALAKPGDIAWDSVFDGAGWFHITGITPAISETAAALSFEAIHKAREKGITVSCDLNYRKSLWKYGKAAPEAMRELMNCVDIAIASPEHVQMALGIRTDMDIHSDSLGAAQCEQLAETALSEFVNLTTIAITLRQSRSASHNGWSACLHDRQRFFISQHYEITHIVDRLGGGDSFAGGLIYGLQTLPDRQSALEFAVAAGCLKHSIPGDFFRFSAEEVTALLEGGGSGRVQR